MVFLIYNVKLLFYSILLYSILLYSIVNRTTVQIIETLVGTKYTFATYYLIILDLFFILRS